MSLLTMLQDVAREIAITPPTSVIASSDAETLRLLALTYRVIEELVNDYSFTELQQEATVTLVAAQDSYALPADFAKITNSTYWDNTNHWMLYGPFSPQEWDLVQHGITQALTKRAFRVKGLTDNQFFLYPTPAAGDAGQLIYYEYISKTAILPVRWTTSTAFIANAYCSYNGNIYRTTLGGTTGATPPTHTAGSVSDGGVTWTYQSMVYDTFIADTDSVVLDERLVGLGVQWRFLRSNGFAYQDLQAEFYESCKNMMVQKNGSPNLCLIKPNRTRWIDSANIPEGNWS